MGDGAREVLQSGHFALQAITQVQIGLPVTGVVAVDVGEAGQRDGTHPLLDPRGSEDREVLLALG